MPVARRIPLVVGVMILAANGLFVTVASASSWHVVASEHATGNYAVAETSGEATKPSKMELKVTGPASLSGLVQWSIECNTNSGAAGKTKKGKVTLKFPGTELLKVPAKSSLCEVAANVQIQGSGKVTISIDSK
jgi:hypothetical protein